MSSREDAIRWLEKRREELLRELSIVEYLLALLSTGAEEPVGEELRIVRYNDGFNVYFPKSLVLDDIRRSYMERRLREILGDKYRLITDKDGRVRGIEVSGKYSGEKILELRSLYKTLRDAV